MRTLALTKIQMLKAFSVAGAVPPIWVPLPDIAERGEVSMASLILAVRHHSELVMRDGELYTLSGNGVYELKNLPTG